MSSDNQLQWERRALELVLRPDTLAEVLDALMRGLEEQAPGALCSVLLLDQAGTRLLHGAAPSLPPEYSQAIDGIAIGSSAGSCGTAAHDNRQVIVADIATDPLWADYRALALRHGLRACWSTPIRADDGRVLGTFATYYREPKRPEPHELELIARAQGIVSVAVMRKQAEAALRASRDALAVSEQRFALAVRGSSDGLWDWDLRTDRTYFAPRWKSMLGFEDHEIANDYAAWADLIHPDDREPTFTALQQYISGTVPTYSPEFRMRCKDGSYKWILARGAVLRDADGTPVRMSGSHSDITERKLAESALRASERMLTAILDTIPVRVFWKNRDLEYLGCNAGFAHDAGVATPEEIVGRTDYDTGWRDHADRYRADDLAVIESGRAKLLIEEPLTMPDGTQITLLASKVPLRNGNGEITGVLGSYLDITERKRAEEEVRRLNAELEATVRARTAELAQREDQLRDIVDGTSELIQTVEMDGTITFTNRAWRETLGYAEAEVQALNLFDVIHPDQRAHCTDILARAAAGESPGVFETVLRTKDGRHCLVEGSMTVRTTNGVPTATRGIFRDVTARRAIDRALRQSEERYGLMIRSSRDAIITLHPPDWHFASGNPAAVALFGASSEAELCAAPPWGLSPETQPDGRRSTDAALQYIESAMGTGSCAFEWVHRRFDGREFVAAVLLSRVEQNNAAYVLATLRDVTAQKQAEGALKALNEDLDRLVTERTGQLRESEERFRHLVESSPNIVLMTRQDGTITFASRRVEGVLGYRPEELIGRSVDVLVPDVSQEAHAQLRALAWAEPQARSMGVGKVLNARRKDGQLVAVEVGLTPVETSSGAFMMATIIDVTAHRQAEAALRASEARKAAIFESALDALITIDADGTVVEWNSAAERMFGYAAADAVGRDMADLIIPPEQRADHKRGMMRHRAGGEATVLQRLMSMSAVRVDGTTFPVELYIAPINSDPPLFTGFIRDITDRLALETRLRQSQKLEAIGQLAGGVAHDFNNILTVVMMQARASAEIPGMPGEALEGLDEIEACATRGAELTRQLLLFSRRQVMQMKDVQLNDVVTAVARMLRRLLGEDITLELQLHASALALRADVSMLDQVLVNLAVNARDAMPSGGRLRVETWERTIDGSRSPDIRPGRYVGFTVRDTGTGIPPEVLPRIFEPFFTTKEAGKGTGLGLATAFGIVQQHRGWLDVTTEMGRGTAVDVYLPSTAPAPARTSAPAIVAPSGGSETILVVEDEAAVRRLLRMTLERRGYTVIEVSTGADALQVWEARHAEVALLLTDVLMPGGVSGHDLSRRLRAQSPDLRVIYCSGYNPETAGRDVAMGVGEAFLQKPFTATDLLTTVRRLLDTGRARNPGV